MFAAAMPPAAVPVVGELRCSISHYRLWCEIDVVIGVWSRNEVVLLNLEAIDVNTIFIKSKRHRFYTGVR